MDSVQRPRRVWSVVLLLGLIFTPCLASCAPSTSALSAPDAPLSDYASVRPIQKIGLIAPFEGLYRRTGYEALAAMRQAIDDAGITEIGLLPLALDDSANAAQAARAAEKMLLTADVAAIVGPLTPGLTSAVAPVLRAQASPPIWITPHAVALDGGFAAPDSEAWAEGLVAAVAGAARAQGAQRLLLAGLHEDWPARSADSWTDVAGMPVAVTDDPAAITASDAVFWVGAAEPAAESLHALRMREVTPPFWLGSAGGDPVFAERAPDTQNVYWATWSRLDYNEWADGRSVATPFAFMVYQATQSAIARTTGEFAASTTPWHVAYFTFNEAGTSIPLSFE